MIDQEMLVAMADLLDQKLDQKLQPVNDRLDRMETDMQDVKADVKHLKEEVQDVKADVKHLKEEVQDVKADVKHLKVDVEHLKEEVQDVRGDLDRMEIDMKRVKVDLLENNVIPRLSTIEGYYIEVSQRYMEKTEQIDAMDEDIQVLQNVVSNHSEKLNKLCAQG